MEAGRQAHQSTGTDTNGARTSRDTTQGRESDQSKESIQIAEGMQQTTEQVSKYIKYSGSYISHYWKRELGMQKGGN